MKHLYLLLLPFIAFVSLTLASCGNDDGSEEKWVKPTFNKASDIIGKKMIYEDVVDKDLNYKYKSSQYSTISFYADGTYKRTFDVYSKTGTFSFANKTATCTETDALLGYKTIIKYEFIDTNKDGYYFKVTSQIYGKDGKANEPFTLYYRFFFTDAN